MIKQKPLEQQQAAAPCKSGSQLLYCGHSQASSTLDEDALPLGHWVSDMGTYIADHAESEDIYNDE